MTIFDFLLIALLVFIFLILIYRYFYKGKFYFTSYYNSEKEYNSTKVNLEKIILYSLGSSNFKNIKQSQNKYTAISLPTMSSFSEIINIEIEEVEFSKIIIKFSSKCLFPLQIFDWGKNKRNSTKFFKNLETQINKSV